MSDELTPRQQILLWDLVSRGGTARQMDIKPTLDAIDRKRLEGAGLLAISKDKGRAIRLTLNEEAAWAYLTTRPPSLLTTGGGSKYDRSILQFVLERIARFASDNSIGLSQVIGARRIVVDEDLRQGPAAGGRRSIAEQIRDTFFILAGNPPANQVRLRALRERLPHLTREALDKALTGMRRDGRASFSKLSNPADIAAEGDAALIVRDQHFHTIWIES